MEFVLAQAVVGKVCEMAIQQAANELSIVLNFREDFEGLKNRIEEIHCALNEADEDGSRKKDSVKNWLHRVRDIAWEAEDILEECAVDSMYETNTQSCTFKCNQLLYRYKMGRRIQKVKSRLSSVVVDGSGLNIVRAAAVPHRQEAAESSSRSEGRWSVLPSESKAVGIESKIESVVNLLENPQIPIIAAVGMGGVGKTYLLQHIYNAQKGRYEKSAWLSISQLYSVSKLQRDLAFQIDEDLCRNINASGISEVLAAEVICRFISEKRCLIVLDDVWRAAREGDLLNKLGIPIGGNSQCKILVSTRSREVAVNLNAEIYGMECLRDEESWRLFCAHAFSKSEGNRGPQYLEKVGRNIVKKCGNLPLAIKITAASLARTVEVSEWQSKLSKLKKVGTSKDPVMDVLMLSYDSLPAHLKACFAYVSFFPEDEIIECEYLIYLWKGEGFIPAGQNPWDCLEQLANLSLLEVWEEEWHLDKYCKIHDLLLDLAIQISGENKCAFRVEDAFGGGQWCRLFLAKKDVDEDAISQRRPVSPTLVRTLSLSRNTNLPDIPDTLLSGMKVLRVLDLSYTGISTLPACVGRMKLLKVLNLGGISGIKEIPECVRHLKSLSYLNLSSVFGVEVPEWIGELRCLQHLEGDFRRMTNGISKLESLRTLRTSSNLSLSMKEDDGVLRIEDIGKMKELEEIAFEVDEESQLKRMEEGILAPLEKMRRLRVENGINGMQGESESDLPQFPDSMSAVRDLELLTLWKFAVPSWICCLTNLRNLYLWNCHCSDYPELQEMPSLVSLQLWWNERCRELAKAFGKSGGFPHLRFFTIFYFPKLEEFPEMEEGAMACLEKLHILGCEKLNKVGEGLERLKTLKEFICTEGTGTDELKETLKEGGMYWKNIKDINPQINIRV